MICENESCFKFSKMHFKKCAKMFPSEISGWVTRGWGDGTIIWLHLFMVSGRRVTNQERGKSGWLDLESKKEVRGLFAAARGPLVFDLIFLATPEAKQQQFKNNVLQLKDIMEASKTEANELSGRFERPLLIS